MAGGGNATKGTDSGGGGGKWIVVVVVLLFATGASCALYLFDSIKLDEAILGVTVVGVIATILALAKK